MERNSNGQLLIFTLLGILCGLAIAVLLQPSPAAAALSAAAPSAAALSVSPSARQAAPSGPSAPAAPAAPVALTGAAFTYQGVLRQSGQAVNGQCDLQFRFLDQATGGVPLAPDQFVTTQVTNGLFTVLLNDAGQFPPTFFNGQLVWIETSVRCPTGVGGYTTLSPAQRLNAVPLAAGLAPNATISSGNTYSGNPALKIQAPAGQFGNASALEAHAGQASSIVGTIYPTGVWGDSQSGYGVWGTTDNGSAIFGLTNGAGPAIHGQSYASGLAGQFDGDVLVGGRLHSGMQVTQVVNSLGPIPMTNLPFNTNGNTLLLFYSGSAYSNAAGSMIGMSIYVDGNFIDSTGIFANNSFTHLAFVPKQWVLTDLLAGAHTLNIVPLNPQTITDSSDIFFVSVTEMPFTGTR